MLLRKAAPWLVLCLTPLLYGCGAGTVPPVHSEPERLATARRLASHGKCGPAVELLKTYIANNAGSTEVDEAIYLKGECHLRMKEWPEAALEFERLLRDYPESDSGGSASFRLGEALFGQARGPDFDQEYTHKALEQWRQYLSTYPGHWLNPEAERRIAETRRRLATKLMNTARLYLKLKLATPARTYFERIVRDYGDLDVVGEAMIGAAQCDAMEGKTREAIERLREVEQRFAGQPLAARAARERARLEH